MTDIRLGDHVRNKVTLFEGHVQSISEHFNRAPQYGVQPKCGADGKIPDSFSIDGFMLEVLDRGFADSLPPIDDSVTIKLGEEVQDRVSGIRGIAMEKCTMQ